MYDQVFYPTAQRLLERVDAVLRLPGNSTGADRGISSLAIARGIPVFYKLDEVPGVQPG